MSSHTPGPWTVNGFGESFSPVARLLPNGVIVSAESARGDEIATARLIAMAPDLLKALRDLRESVVEAYKAGRIPAEPFVRAGNVLAEAEGKS